MEPMTPKHPRWDEFVEKLEGLYALYQNCQEHWCHNDFSSATAILVTMGDIDIPKSLQYFEAHGGYCDCEILYNVVGG